MDRVRINMSKDFRRPTRRNRTVRNYTLPSRRLHKGAEILMMEELLRLWISMNKIVHHLQHHQHHDKLISQKLKLTIDYSKIVRVVCYYLRNMWMKVPKMISYFNLDDDVKDLEGLIENNG